MEFPVKLLGQLAKYWVNPVNVTFGSAAAAAWHIGMTMAET
jgi:hypothetical protein